VFDGGGVEVWSGGGGPGMSDVGRVGASNRGSMSST
jgi:hypothetical protein